jgi:hypothetical protein
MFQSSTEDEDVSPASDLENDEPKWSGVTWAKSVSLDLRVTEGKNQPKVHFAKYWQFF